MTVVTATVPKSAPVAPVNPLPVIVTRRAAHPRSAARAHARDDGGGHVREISAVDVADVPAGVVTVTSTAPVPAGLSTVIVVSLTTVKSVAGVAPKSTTVAPRSRCR